MADVTVHLELSDEQAKAYMDALHTAAAALDYNSNYESDWNRAALLRELADKF